MTLLWAQGIIITSEWNDLYPWRSPLISLSLSETEVSHRMLYILCDISDWASHHRLLAAHTNICVFFFFFLSKAVTLQP